jgi:phenylalanine-4-hydroxylase
VKTPYDITKPQPQLFVAKDFAHLTKVLQEFAATMAFRTGGKSAVEKAVEAKTVCTVELDSGIQFSGVVENFREKAGKLAYVKLAGPTQLAHHDLELDGQGPEHHKDGFSTVIGALKATGRSAAELSDAEIGKLTANGVTTLEFASGIRVAGRVKSATRKNGKLLVLTLEDCTAVDGDDFLFKPEWGVYDLACGEDVVSVFGGPADRKAYVAKTGGWKQSPMTPKSNLTPANRALNALYAEIRMLRETGTADEASLARIAGALDREYPEDWLARIEILELLVGRGPAEPSESLKTLEARLRLGLNEIRKLSPDRDEMIGRGLALLDATTNEGAK